MPLTFAFALLAFRNPLWIRRFALGTAVLEFLLAVMTLLQFDPHSSGVQFIERHTWISSLQIGYLLGVDGISIAFLPLTALLTIAVILASWHRVAFFPSAYFSLILALEGITIGVYCALDLMLFFLFWELSLVPLFFLIRKWGIGPQRQHAAFQYTIFMLAGGLLILGGFILLALNHASELGSQSPAGLSFDYLALLKTPASIKVQSVAFFLLFLGFAVKAPLFPFHSWLPVVAMQGPPAVTAIIVGLKMGLFGIIRFVVPLAPQATNLYSNVMALMGITGALYGGLIALKQTNLRRLLAYASISHVGLVLIGISALNIQGIQGATFQLFNFGIVSSGIFLLTGFIHHRLGSTELTAMGGIASIMPRLTALFFILGLSSLGIPGTSGFPAEHLIVIGALKSHPGTGLAALLGVIIGAAYFLGFFQKGFLGPITHRSIASLADLLPREAVIAGALLIMTLGLGFAPQTFLEITEKSLREWVARTESVQESSSLATADRTDRSNENSTVNADNVRSFEPRSTLLKIPKKLP